MKQDAIWLNSAKGQHYIQALFSKNSWLFQI